MIIVVPIAIIIGFLLWILRPGRTPTHPRKTALLATVIPPAAASIAAVIIQAAYNAAGNEGVSDISNNLFVAGLGIIGAAIIACIIFAALRKGEIAKGIGFSICIAVILKIIELGFLE